MKRHSNNSYGRTYSHKYARANYQKKCPKDIRKLVMAELRQLEINSNVTVEGISKRLNVLHKYVHVVFMELQRSGAIRLGRDGSRSFRFSLKDKMHTLPLYRSIDAIYEERREPKMYWLVKVE